MAHRKHPHIFIRESASEQSCFTHLGVHLGISDTGGGRIAASSHFSPQKHAAAESACSDPYRQLSDSTPVKPAGLLNITRKLLCLARTHTHTHTHSWHSEHVEGQSLTRQLELPSRPNSPDLEQVRQSRVDLFAAQANARCDLWFSLSLQNSSPQGVNAFAHGPGHCGQPSRLFH